MRQLFVIALSMVPLAANYALAASCDRMAIYRSCMSAEGGKPDSTRSGVSASEFCQTQTVMDCPY